jgi:tetratricopeptide (TPR) repeat protein
MRIFVKQILFCNCLLFVFLFTSCTPKGTDYYSELEKNVKNPSTIEEYENGIAAHNAQIKKIVELDSQTGIWYKILGSRYLDKKMYGKALESFQMAIQYYPENANLYYYVAVCAGYMAKSSLDYDADGANSQQLLYWKLAETSYLQAINYNTSYSRALYGLGVLYVFELNSPLKAIPYLEKLLTVESKHLDGMMVLARAYYVTGDSDKAVALYDKIIAETTDKTRKAEAEANKKTVLNQSYNNQE